MAARRSQPPPKPPTLPHNRAYSAIKRQLDALQELLGKDYRDVEHQEREWTQLTQSIIERAFGDPSSNLSHFYNARSAGNYRVLMYGEPTPHHENQQNLETRIKAFEAFLRGCLSELEMFMPESEIKGQYAAGDEYEFYRDIKSIIGLVTTGIMIIDPYISGEIFDLYADGVPPAAHLRILTNNLPGSVLAIAQKYAVKRALELRTTNLIHDRIIIIDNRAWAIGQSIKDAAKKKPTYIVEQDGTLVRPTYENLWNGAIVVI